MFNNLLKGNKGKTTTKILATLLVITLTFANFALLGTFMLESIAASENVKLDAYLELNNPSATEVSKDINSEDLVLYVAISVEGDGRLEKGIIDFSNANFKSKENEKLQQNLEIINTGDKEIIKIPIVAKKDSKFDLSLLNMSSQISLKGEYIDKNGSSTNIDLTKTVKVNWVANEITPEEVEFSQEVITNKTYEINEQDKRVIQLLVKANIKENKVPVKSTKIEIENPIAGVTPEEVKVTSYNTGATNGGTSVEFNNKQGSSWENKENKTYIELKNEKDEKNCVAWKKDATDELIVTYIYGKDTNVVPFSSKAKVAIEVYGNESKVEKENTLSLEAIEEKGEIINIKNSVAKNIYKGNMYLGQDTDYKTKYDVFVSYNLGGYFAIYADEDKVNSKNVATYYKKTLINKEQAINILGNNGVIDIINSDTEEKISTIDLSKEHNEENYTISYPENVSKITIASTDILKEGHIEIINEKTIKVLKTEEIEAINELATSTLLAIVVDEEKMKVVPVKVDGKTNLLEPKTAIDVALDKQTISNQVENDLIITATLNSNNYSNKLFENPTIDIELPKEITEATLGNISLVNEEELKIKSSAIKTSESGNKVISIVLEGKQTKYNASEALKGANIVVPLKVKAELLMADKDLEIKTICKNNEETVEAKNNLKITSKDGLVYKNTIKQNDNISSEINKDEISIHLKENNEQKEIIVQSTLINNYKKEIKDLNIIGRMPVEKENNIATIEKLASQDYTVFYSEDAAATANSENWVTDITDFSKVKSFKIQIAEIKQGESINVEYKMILPAVLNKDEVNSKIELDYKVEETSIQKAINFKMINNNNVLPKPEEIPDDKKTIIKTEQLQAEVSVTSAGEVVTDEVKIREGQVIDYEVKVKNISNEALKNVKITSTKENGNFYALVFFDYTTSVQMIPTYVYDEDEAKKEEVASVETLNSGDELVLKYKIIAHSNCDGKDLLNVIKINAENLEELEIKRTNKIEDGKIKILTKYGNTENVEMNTLEDMKYIIEVENISDEDLTNITVKTALPEILKYSRDSFEGQNKVIDGQTLTYILDEIKKGEKASITIWASVDLDKFGYGASAKNVLLQSKATVGEEEYKSNIYEREIKQELTTIDVQLTTSAKEDQQLKNGEELIYNIKIKNTGPRSTNIGILDSLPYGLQVQNIKVIKGENEETIQPRDRVIEYNCNLAAQEEIEIQIVTKLIIEEIRAEDDSSKIINELTVEGDNILNPIIKEISSLIETLPDENEEDNELPPGENPDDLDDPEDPEGPDNPNDPEDPDIPENPDNPDQPEFPDDPDDPEDTDDPEGEIHTISGLVWLDENKNGKRDNNEKIMQGIKVMLLNKNGEVIKDKNGEVITTITSVTGTYKFNNIQRGEYLVAFAYDAQKYTVSKYKVEDASFIEDSDVISKELLINNEKTILGITDVIKVVYEDIKYIDMGLVQNAEFDLSLEKYIAKIIVTNSKGSTSYEYEEANLAKIEIAAKQVEGSTILVQYEIKIINNGDIKGYINDVIDYIPKELTFNSEMNPEWYSDSEGNLHNASLEKEAIEPGQSKTVKLVLTKILDNNSLGTIENLAEIGKNSNLENVQDKDSIAGNKKQGEDDICAAELIISIKTGGPTLYIGIVIICSLVLSCAIYIINKKVIQI